MARNWTLGAGALALALSLSLAGCGGSSSSGGAKNNTGNVGDSTGTVTPAGGSGSPPTVTPASCTTQACVDSFKDALDEANAALAALLKTDYTASQKKAADKAVADAQKDYDDAVVARNKYVAAQPPTYALKAMDTAISTPATLGGGIVAGNGTATTTVDGGEVTVTPSADAYSKATWPVAAISGWMGSVWERETPTEDSVVVYTNQQAKKSGKYSDYFPAGASAAPTTGATSGFSWAPWINAVSGVSNNADRVITLLNTALGAKDHEKISFPGLPTTANGAQTFVDDATTTGVDERKIKGTFYGVLGTFACTGAGVTCTATNDAKGNLTTLTTSNNGNWTFTPDKTSATIADIQTDADYMDFGYWVQTGESDGNVTYKASTFFRGAMPSQASNDDVTSLEGSATYKGGAAGLYTKRAFAAGGDGAVTNAGRFTADAELTANFFGDDVASSKHNSITGTIKNFMDGANVIDAAWSVELKKAAINAAGQIGGTTPGATTGGGTWTGRFYGAVEQDSDNDGSNGNQSVLPSGVAGEFTAGFNNGNVMGAFGATKTSK